MTRIQYLREHEDRICSVSLSNIEDVKKLFILINEK
jgi:hypothetical protein